MLLHQPKRSDVDAALHTHRSTAHAKTLVSRIAQVMDHQSKFGVFGGTHNANGNVAPNVSQGPHPALGPEPEVAGQFL